MNKKYNRKSFLEKVALESGYNVKDVTKIYHNIVDEMEKILLNGDKVMLSGFGSFYIKEHKGHPVNFGNKDNVLPSYNVVKFAPSNLLNKKVRKKNYPTLN